MKKKAAVKKIVKPAKQTDPMMQFPKGLRDLAKAYVDCDAIYACMLDEFGDQLTGKAIHAELQKRRAVKYAAEAKKSAAKKGKKK